MEVNAEDLITMLKKLDEAEERAARCSFEDLRAAIEKMRELRAILYGLLSRALQTKDGGGGNPSMPGPIGTPLLREIPLWEITCGTRGDSSKV